MFGQADVDKNGTIDYHEFITATINRHKLEREENLFKAFQYFDKDNSGSVFGSFALSLTMTHIAWLTSNSDDKIKTDLVHKNSVLSDFSSISQILAYLKFCLGDCSVM